MLPLFINSVLPPNLYYTLRVISSLVVGEVPGWNEQISIENDND